MNRRAFIGLLGGATATWPPAAHAQQPAMRRSACSQRIAMSVQARPARISPRPQHRADRGPERRGSNTVGPRQVERLAGSSRAGALAPDVIMTTGGPPLRRSPQATPRPFRSSLSLSSRPGRLGLRRQPGAAGRQPHRHQFFRLQLGPKRLELLHELVPGCAGGVLVNPARRRSPSAPCMEAAAPSWEWKSSPERQQQPRDRAAIAAFGAGARMTASSSQRPLRRSPIAI